MSFKTFSQMISTLRAAKAAGMECEITVKPDAAGDLADILETHQNALRSAIAESVRPKRSMWWPFVSSNRSQQ